MSFLELRVESYLQGPTENRQGEWAPWIIIIIITIIIIIIIIIIIKRESDIIRMNIKNVLKDIVSVPKGITVPCFKHKVS